MSKSHRTSPIMASASVLALAGALLAASAARAADECGAASGGSVTCIGASYGSITYQAANGLNLNLDNPQMAVSGAVSLSAAGSAGDVDLNLVHANTIGGLVSVNGQGSGVAALAVNSGTLTASGSYSAEVFHTGSGPASITVNGGQIVGLGGLLAENSGSGDARVVINSGLVAPTSTSQGAISVQAYVPSFAQASPSTASVTLAGGSVTSINGTAVSSINNTTTGSVLISMTGGSVSGNVGLDAFASAGTARLVLSGGSVTASAYGARAATDIGAAGLTMTGGAVLVSASSANGFGLVAQSSLASGHVTTDTSIVLSGGSVSVNGPQAAGLFNTNGNFGRAIVQMSGGTVSAGGRGSDGILARDDRGAGYNVQITGGSITGGSGVAAALHTASPNGGSILIGAGATVDGTASGVAIRDGDLNNDGVDETGGAAAITTAGTLKGAIVLGSGLDTVSVTGGSIAGDIKGGGAATLDFALGQGTFTYGSAYAISGIDALSVSSGATQIDGTFSVNTLTVRGGNLTLTGMDQAAQTMVSSGLLTVNGTLTSHVAVQNGGKLGGDGKVVGAVAIQSGGAVTPGNSIGQLQVNGAFTQAAGSIYQAEFKPAAATSDRIVVSGAAILSPGAMLTPIQYAPGMLTPGTRYVVLTASGGLTGTYTVTPVGTAFLTLKDSYDANDAYLDVVQTRPLTAAARTPNQSAVAAATPLSGQMGLVLLNLPTDAAAQAAFDQLTPLGFTAVNSALVSDARLVRAAAVDRLLDCGEQPVAAVACPDSDHAAGWSQGVGGWGRTGASSTVAGFRHAASGFMVGADTPLAAGERVGIFAGYSRGQVKVDTGSARIDNYHFGAYGGLLRGAVALRADAAFSYDAVDSARTVSFAGLSDHPIASYGARTFQVEGEAGYRLSAAGGMTLEPFAGIAFVSVHSDGFREVGQGAAVMVQPGGEDLTYATLGVRPAAAFQLGGADAVLRGLAGWRYASGDLAPRSAQAFAGGATFGIQGAPLARSAGVAGAELAVRLGQRIAMALSYGGEFSGGDSDQTMRATMAIRF